jgi:hypothetical protein
MKIIFIGYEVVANGVTVDWTPNSQVAEKSYSTVRGSASMYKHLGNDTKTLVKSKLSTFKLKELVRNWSV